MAKKPILSLDTFTERELVEIKTLDASGAPVSNTYEMRNPGEIGIVEWNRIQRGFNRMAEVNEKLKASQLGSDDITDEELQGLDDITRKTVSSVLVGVPDDVLAALSLTQCQQIVSTFISGRQSQAPSVDETQEMAPTILPEGMPEPLKEALETISDAIGTPRPIREEIQPTGENSSPG